MLDKEINTETLPTNRLVFWKSRQLVSRNEALADSAHATPVRFVGTAGISWIEPRRVFFEQKGGYQPDRDPPERVKKKFREIRRAAADQ